MGDIVLTEGLNYIDNVKGYHEVVLRLEVNNRLDSYEVYIVDVDYALEFDRFGDLELQIHSLSGSFYDEDIEAWENGHEIVVILSEDDIYEGIQEFLDYAEDMME